MSDRRQRFAVNAAVCLTHDIQFINHHEQTLSALLLNVKKAFNHVSLNQLLKIMQDLYLLYILTKWIQSFLLDQTVSLVFNEERNSDQKVKSEILQSLSISSILFLIYIRFLFIQVKKQHTDSQIKILSYIDDVTVMVKSKSAEENSIMLKKVVKSLFLWAKDNVIVFDDSKIKFIYFNKDKEIAISTVTLLNNIIIKSSELIQWLEMWFDWKLTFKDYIKKKIVSVTRTLHLLHRLFSSE